MYHNLKIENKYFNAILLGEKTFEIRKNDRSYSVGDVLIFSRLEGRPWNRKLFVAECRVTYMTDYKQQSGYVVMSIVVESIREIGKNKILKSMNKRCI